MAQLNDKSDPGIRKRQDAGIAFMAVLFPVRLGAVSPVRRSIRSDDQSGQTINPVRRSARSDGQPGQTVSTNGLT
ncbi:hypothetical protein [Paenibacillus pinistramenti]|uniref:hypothetical protein n=1 Tax=Paenibacillus pinistramenti TaxID=1768003 RepID=UPI0011095B49|nr:hypothetical protein [Paenibacillus pinistramenti]